MAYQRRKDTQESNCKFSDKRTATEIECELVVNGLLEEVRE